MGSVRARSPTGSVQAGPTSRGNPDIGSDNKDGLKIEHFEGNRAKLGFFLTQLKAVFKLQPNKYPRPADKVLFAAMQLRGPAFAWFQPTMDDWLESETPDPETTEMFRAFPNFEGAIKQVFGIGDGEERAAARAIHRLKQKGSAAQYYSQFKQLAARLDWNNDAFGSAYYEGLKDAVKDQMINEIPEQYKELVDKSIEIDNRLYERRMEKGGWAGRGRSGRNNTQNYGDPMDLDMIEKPRPSRPNGNHGRTRGRNERDKRREKGLCFNCGKSGHRARECKAPSQPLHMINRETAGIPAKKADTGMKPTPAAKPGQGEEDKAQKGLEATEQRTMTWWERYQARINALPRHMTWGSSDSDHEPESQEEELPWVVIPAQAEAPTAAKEKERATSESNTAPLKRTDLDRARPRNRMERRFPTHETIREQHAKTPWNQCWDDDCTAYHRPKSTIQKVRYHNELPWEACKDHSCEVHQVEKEHNNPGWYPEEPVPYPPDVTGNDQHPNHSVLPEHACTSTYCKWHKTGNLARRPISRERARPQEPRSGIPTATRKPQWRRKTTITVEEEDHGSDSEEANDNFDKDQEYHFCMMNADGPVTSPYFKKEEQEVGNNCKPPGPFNPDCQECQDNQKYGGPLSGCCTECDQGSYTKREVEDAKTLSNQIKEELEQDDSSDGDPMEDPYGLPEARTYDEVTERKSYLVTGIDVTSLLVTTNRWRYAWCTPEPCEQEAQHTHVLFDPTARPKANLRTFRVKICQKSECGQSMHLHYPWGTSRSVLRVPPNIQRQIERITPEPEEGTESPNLDMIIRQLGTVETRIDERGSAEHLAEIFDCMDTKCPEFYADHHHVYNVDPRYPSHAMSPLGFQRVLKLQGPCTNPKCEWKENLHVHFDAKNDQGKAR